MNAPIQTQPTTTALAPFAGASAGALLMSEVAMERIERVADFMASGKTTVPQHLRGSKGDCFAITLQAMSWGMNPFAVAQKTHLVNGVLGYEAQLVAAVINNSGIVADRFHFEWYGPWQQVVGKFIVKKNQDGKEYRTTGWTMADEAGCGIRVWATLKGEREPRVLELLLAQARVRNSTLWADDPKQQLAYLAQKRWARLYAPDVILGVYTADELAEPGEKFMGMVDEVGTEAPPPPPPPAPAPKTYDPEKFKANFPKWAETIRTGRKVADAYIHFNEQRGEPLSAEQIEKLRAVKVDSPATATDVQPRDAAAAPPQQQQAPTEDVSDIEAQMANAQSCEDLQGLDEVIGAVEDAATRERLVAALVKRQDELPPF